MARGADAGRSEIKSLGPRLQMRGEVGKICGGNFPADRQDLRKSCHVAHGHKIGQGIVRQFRKHMRIDGKRSWRACQKRVAVRFRTSDRFRADIPVAPGAILDNDVLAQVLGDVCGHNASHDVSRAPGRKWHDDADVTLRPSLPGWPKSRAWAKEPSPISRLSTPPPTASCA